MDRIPSGAVLISGNGIDSGMSDTTVSRNWSAFCLTEPADCSAPG